MLVSGIPIKIKSSLIVSLVSGMVNQNYQLIFSGYSKIPFKESNLDLLQTLLKPSKIK
jgi:hypothetical protein